MAVLLSSPHAAWMIQASSSGGRGLKVKGEFCGTKYAKIRTLLLIKYGLPSPAGDTHAGHMGTAFTEREADIGSFV